MPVLFLARFVHEVGPRTGGPLWGQTDLRNRKKSWLTKYEGLSRLGGIVLGRRTEHCLGCCAGRLWRGLS